jgi:hypothetical protein
MPSLVSLAANEDWDECLAMLERGEGDVHKGMTVRPAHVAAWHAGSDPNAALVLAATPRPRLLAPPTSPSLLPDLPPPRLTAEQPSMTALLGPGRAARSLLLHAHAPLPRPFLPPLLPDCRRPAGENSAARRGVLPRQAIYCSPKAPLGERRQR